MPRYTDIFFDLDHTLWDFRANSFDMISELYFRHDVEALTGAPLIVFIKTYRRFNQRYWNKYAMKEVSKEELRIQRFKDCFASFGFDDEDRISQFSHDYSAEGPHKNKLMDGAREALEYASKKYRLHLITNGFDESQRVKIEACKIGPYFDQLIISENTGYRKPDPEIFEFALKQANTTAGQSVMVGDHYDHDIIGARIARIDQVYVNENPVEGFNSTYYLKTMRDFDTIL